MRFPPTAQAQSVIIVPIFDTPARKKQPARTLSVCLSANLFVF
ncbi:hypothetical protein HMPREF9098_0032 [Kingella denitrificans ATCC 33394]|uniref:Uncharacterized protein n=1 Tax=Kingella denitrificans ATCC 33394 TaxID=888741 RepID=F0EVZ8_9NEIS|nr:hypothetical protein HMPREF9098_0032 [Kingella denitrificans ATCC 33394]